MRRTAPLAAVALAATIAGCATMTGKIEEPPRVSLVSIVPEEFQLFEQRYRVKLRVLNPNDATLSIRGLSYEIDLNGRPFGNGVSGEPVQVEPFGEQTVSVVVLSNIARIYEQIREVTSSGRKSISYAVRGSVSVEGALGRVPFEHEGEVSLEGFASVLPGTRAVAGAGASN